MKQEIFTFENQLNPNIQVVIKATSLEEAEELLSIDVKNPEDYKLYTPF